MVLKQQSIAAWIIYVHFFSNYYTLAYSQPLFTYGLVTIN